MKKVISIVLALLMMIPMAAMLVPTASAAPTTPDVSAAGTAGKVFYEENFDDPALAGLNDAQLATALGWSKPADDAAIWIEDGAFRLVSQYTKDKTQEAKYTTGVDANGKTTYSTKWGSGYETSWVKDAYIEKNAIVVEYTVTAYRRAAGAENNFTYTLADGTQKTIYAQGQGAYQGFGAYYKDGYTGTGTDNFLMRFNPNGSGRTNTYKAYDTPITAETQKGPYWKTTSHELVNPIPEGETFVLEYNNEPWNQANDLKNGATTGKYYNREYDIKIIVEPFAHRCYTFVDNVLVESMADVNMANYNINDWNRQVTSHLGFQAKLGCDLKLDNIKVSEFVPGLTISEIMTNGQFRVNGTALQYAATAVGHYQWIEITNPGYAPVNVYDYGIQIFNMATYRTTIGSENLGSNDASEKGYYLGGAPTVGYFTPGAKTLGTEVFNSPSYENGVLQPGESAVVLIPQTAMEGKLSVTDTAFRNYLVGLGMPEDTMLLVADNKSDYPFALSHHAGEGASVSILRVDNKATNGGYDPVAPAIGQNARFINAFAECTAIITSKNGGGTNYYGMQVKPDSDGDNFQSNLPKCALNDGAGWTKNNDGSFEINYSGWETAHDNIQWGFAKYGPTEARKDINGTDVYATPGFVPTDCRRVVYVDLIDADGNATRKVVNVHSDVTVATPTVPGYDTRVLVNGEVVVAKATADTAKVTVADSSTTIKVELYREGSGFVGYQTSAVDEDGYYDLRLLAAVNSFEDYKKLGFRVTFDDAGDRSKTVEYEVAYVYTAVTEYTDGSEEIVSAEDYKSNYLYALHIKGVDSYLDLSVKVEVIYSLDGETWLTGTDNVDGFFAIDVE